MTIFKQKTIAKNVKLDGVGLHSGKKASIVIKPANPNTGIIFKRIDLNENNEILPDVYNVCSAILCTTISNEFGVKVSTIEHLMGALFGLGIDNALIEIDNEEVPILDGSAKNFIEKIVSSGFEISEEPIKIIKINQRIEYSDGKRFISIEPSKLSLDIDFELKYENKIIGNQRNKINVYEDNLEAIFNSRIYLFIWLSIILWAILATSWLPILYFLLPQFYGKTLHKLVAFTQHAGLARNVKDHRLSSREMYLNPVLSFLYWKMEYHLTHHMFPTVPSYNLDKLHHHIKDQLPRTNEGLIDAYKEIIPAIMKQSKDEDYFLIKDVPQLQNV